MEQNDFSKHVVRTWNIVGHAWYYDKKTPRVSIFTKHADLHLFCCMRGLFKQRVTMTGGCVCIRACFTKLCDLKNTKQVPSTRYVYCKIDTLRPSQVRQEERDECAVRDWNIWPWFQDQKTTLPSGTPMEATSARCFTIAIFAAPRGFKGGHQLVPYSKQRAIICSQVGSPRSRFD